MSNYYQIGKLVASTGLLGELILEHNLGKKSELKDQESLFIEDKNGNMLPFFIEKAKAKSATEIIVKLEGVDIVEDARKLTPKKVFLSAEDFSKHAAAGTPVSLLGFNLYNDNELIGEIYEVVEQHNQFICAVDYKGKEVLVPVHTDNLISVDNEQKKIFVRLPEGLLEIYI